MVGKPIKPPRWCSICKKYRGGGHDHGATLFDQDEEPKHELIVPTTEPVFGGPTYEPEFDAERLGKQARSVFKLMSDERWRSLADIARDTGYPEASVSARLRDFRKRRFGGFIVERQRVAGGLYHYRLIKGDEP
jgi:hypothetical protein